jgi:putative hydrolase of the HAD superfamily
MDPGVEGRTQDDVVQSSRITTLIFDVDDTLYDVCTGFTKNRNGSAVYQFMVEYLHFQDLESAKIVRDEYFERYHATAKGLQIAEREGRFPPIKNDNISFVQPNDTSPAEPRFKVQDLSNYWASKLDYSLLGGTKTQLIQDLSELASVNDMVMIAFSNGPRNYVLRVLQELGLLNTIFTEDRIFAVDDVLPHCKPEKEAFESIFKRLGKSILPSECVMIEDSLKNIVQAKQLGMKTIFVKGSSDQSDEAKEGNVIPSSILHIQL